MKKHGMDYWKILLKFQTTLINADKVSKPANIRNRKQSAYLYSIGCIEQSYLLNYLSAYILWVHTVHMHPQDISRQMSVYD